MWEPRPGCKCTKWFIHPTIKKKTRDKNSKNKISRKQEYKKTRFQKQEYKNTGIQETRKQVFKAYTKESRILTRRRVFYTREGGGEGNATQQQAQPANFNKELQLKFGLSPFSFIYFVFYLVFGGKIV